MKNRKFLLTLQITILMVLFMFLAACGAKEAPEAPVPEEPIAEETVVQAESSKPPGDYVYCLPEEDCTDWTIKITIPKMDGLVEVNNDKEQLELDEMLEYDISEFEPKKAVINFCIREKGTEKCRPIKQLSPSMIIEYKFESDGSNLEGETKLGYLYVDKANEANNKWEPFKFQWKCDGVAVAITSEWSDDPQVAWGY